MCPVLHRQCLSIGGKKEAPVFPFYTGLRDVLLHGACAATAIAAASAGEFHFCRELQSWKSQRHITGGEKHLWTCLSLCTGSRGGLAYFQRAGTRSGEHHPKCVSLPSVPFSAAVAPHFSRPCPWTVIQFLWTASHVSFRSGCASPSSPSF